MNTTPLTLWTQHPMCKGGKMAGMWSWGNTSPLSNPFCMNKCTFENHCYAYQYCSIRPKVHNAYARNLELLKKPLNPRLLWAPLGSHRIQSFGEISNSHHLRNILNLCIANPQSKFTIWTHRWKLFKNIQTPKNLQVIASGEYLSSKTVPGFPTFLVCKEPPECEHIECKGQCIKCGYCYGWNRHAGLNPDIAIWEKPK